MPRELPARFGIAPHAAKKLVRRQIALGVACSLISVGLIAIGASVGVGVPLFCMSALFVGLGLYNRSLGAAVQVLNKSFNAASFGHLKDAVELLDYAEETFQLGYVRRIIDLQRAIIAMRRGDIDAALLRADAAIARPVRLLTRQQERIQIASAHALRAVLRAGAGKEGARADIDFVRKSPHAGPEALARAELAEALLLERAGRMEDLREHLTRERRLLLEHTHPRERAIVRGYQRMLKAKSTTVYRTPSPRAPAGDEEPALADWAAKLSPGVAPFVRAPAPTAGAAEVLRDADAQPIDGEAVAAAEGRSKVAPVRRAWPVARLVLLWGLLSVMFFAIWQFLSPGPGRYAASEPSPVSSEELATLLVVGLPMIFLVVVGGLLARRVLQLRRHGRQIVAAIAALARGEEDRAQKDLAALGKSPGYLVGAQAHLALAEAHERRGDLPAALAACEAGLARLNSETTRMVAADILLPTLLAERAFVFAAMDRPLDARAEIALIAERYPSYPYLDKARLRVALVQKARQGDIAGAARLAEQSADLPLNLRDELLGDLARAADRPEAAGAGEMERLREELRVDAVAKRWLDVVAPKALHAFSRAGEAAEDTRDARAEVEAKAEAEAEAEMHAEAEAEAEGVAVR